MKKLPFHLLFLDALNKTLTVVLWTWDNNDHLGPNEIRHSQKYCKSLNGSIPGSCVLTENKANYQVFLKPYEVPRPIT